MARYSSWLRPKYSPIFAFTNSERLRNQLNLYWGMTSHMMQFNEYLEPTILRAEQVLLDEGLLAKGDQVVIISDILARDKVINAVQMLIVE